ncbi:MAG TPA: histidine kinase [Nocardioidaceae bacterium]|nr:histidine kinase [Nocardioidaceae bacterium]
MTTNRPAWVPGLVIGLVVLAFGAWEVFDAYVYRGVSLGLGLELGAGAVGAVLVVLFIATAAGLHRVAPGIALALVWAGCGLQLLSGTDILYAELGVLVVAFGCARWGSTLTVWLSGASIPAGALIAVGWVLNHGTRFGDVLFDNVFTASRAAGIDLTRGVVVFMGFVFLALPWLVGLVLRVRAQASRAREQEREALASKQQAEEIAALREQQTRMAHDVHDVVGHSLAVILMQAESAQFLPDDDPARMKETMANIAVSARQSLRDVRQVLQATEAPPQQDGGLDRLVEGVRAAGNEVRSTVVGTPRPLPPELDAVAYRTLQEMLTNAIKHGTRGAEVTVLRHWADDLTIAVQNSATQSDVREEGLGLAGMRMRLESVGGLLDLRHEDGSFTATAKLPLRHSPTGQSSAGHGMMAP